MKKSNTKQEVESTMKSEYLKPLIQENGDVELKPHSDIVYPRTNVEDLSFAKQKLLTGKHRIHPYPAMMHPMLVERLLSKYGKPGDVVFDPFCGSGSVLSGASEKGFSSIGFDINPLALLIATVKTCQYEPSVLSSEIDLVLSKLKRVRKINVPPINNIEFWYADSIISELGKIRHVLRENSLTYRLFFVAAFAHTCRISSYTRNQEFKRYRENTAKRQRPNGFAMDFFVSHLQKVKHYYLEYTDQYVSSEIRLENSASSHAFDFEFDLVVTSPPYGDHSTTVAYGQFSSFANEWTKDLNPFNSISYSVDSEGLGKKDQLNINLSDYPSLSRTIAQISHVKPSRGLDVLHFFNGYVNVLKKISSNIQIGGIACFVVGNRRVAGLEIPLDQITAEMFDQLGFSFVEIGCRSITNKVMPLQNSPSNVVGKRGSTMTSEYVVVFRK